MRRSLGLALVLLLAAPAAAQQSHGKIRAAYSAISGAMLPAWVAKEKALFAKHGVDVELSYIAAGPKLLGALLSGELQFGVLGHQGVDAAAAGAEIVYVASGLDHLVFYLFAGMFGGWVFLNSRSLAVMFVLHALWNLAIPIGHDLLILQHPEFIPRLFGVPPA